MRTLSLLLAATAAFLPEPAVAQERTRTPAERNCSDDRGVDRCSGEQHRRVLTLFGLQPIETHAAAGDLVRRVFYVDGYGRDVVAISFLRRREQDAAMFVHFPRREGEAPRPPMQVLISEALWTEIEAASDLFDRDLAPAAPASPGSDVFICAHSWVYTVEAVEQPEEDKPARIRRKTQDACANGPAEQFAQLVHRRAVPLLPHCAVLDPSDHRNGATLLAACSLLSGDRIAAAHAMNAAQALRDISEPDDLARVREVFRPAASLTWPGADRPTRGDAAARAWHSGVTEVHTNFYIEGAHGLSPGRARVTGKLWRSADADGNTSGSNQQAPVELTWVREPHGEWQLESAVVGRFTPTRSF
jgi:hypothetical protein